VTDAPSRQDTPENEDGHPARDPAAAAPPQVAPPTARWSPQQPAPAPWFLGQPGTPAPPGWAQPPGPPLPPPSADQANWPEQAPGTRPEGPTGDPGHNEPTAASPAPGVPPWTGTAPTNPQQPAGTPPWHDPNRYSQPGGGPPRQEKPPARYGPAERRGEAEPGKRPPLDLRTRWARGLAVGGTACMLITLLNSYRNFPTWLIGAAFSLALSLTALWFGVFAQRDAARSGRRAPEAITSIVWSSISTLIALSVVAFSLVCYPQLKQYSDCMRAANTLTSQSTCQTQLEKSLVLKP
jgi:hypothetical protein